MIDNANCPDCQAPQFTRRRFVQAASSVAAAATFPQVAFGKNGVKGQPTPESLVKKLYGSLSTEQKGEICFPWDYSDDRGLLRTHVSNNWNITDTEFNVAGKFFTKDQQELIEAIFLKLYNPDWHQRIHKQLQDDAGGYGKRQTIAIFGEPASGKFEFVMTGRHLTIRCDGDSTEHVAFGGPIFYGHQASKVKGLLEKEGHPGNIYWHQALKANALFQMLNGKQRQQALVAKAPRESNVPFQGQHGELSGIPITELTADQKEHVQAVLQSLLEPYRVSDREEVIRCLRTQGGLDKCSITFFKSGDLGEDQVWDIWRLEGPSFVWHYRGYPHVHVWVNVADNPAVKLNAKG